MSLAKRRSGFASDPQRASRAGKTTKSRQSPEERTRRAREAALVRWSRPRIKQSMEYEDSTLLNAGKL